MNLYDEARKVPADRGDFGPCDDDWKLVKRVEATRTGGRASNVYVKRMPAHFWRLVSGDIEITTGSGREIAELIERLARALGARVIGFQSVGDEINLTGSGRDIEDLIAAFEAERGRGGSVARGRSGTSYSIAVEVKCRHSPRKPTISRARVTSKRRQVTAPLVS